MLDKPRENLPRRRNEGKPPARRIFTPPARRGRGGEVDRPAEGVFLPYLAGTRIFVFDWTFVLFVVAPTVCAAVYYLFLAHDRYQVEAEFVVRQASTSISASGEGGGAAMGISAAMEDTFAAEDFMVSRDAMSRLRESVDLREIYGRAGRDVLMRFPPLLSSDTNEALFAHFQRFVKVERANSTRLSTLNVVAFTPDDARRIAERLLEVAEARVNELNLRAQADTIEDANARLQTAKDELFDIQKELTAFRTRELLVDPSEDAVALGELIGELNLERASLNASIRQFEATAPNSPQLPAMRRRAQALEQQIARERGRISSSSDRFAEKFEEYERLQLEMEVAVGTVEAAITTRELAQRAADEQKLYLIRVSGPTTPDAAAYPDRMLMIVAVATGAALFYGVAWMLATGMQAHLTHRSMSKKSERS